MIHEIDTLYKRGRGKILEWIVKIESINGKVNLMFIHGEFLGAKSISWRNDRKGKNIGKINETNPFEQAKLEAQSEINKKLKEGYKSYKELSKIHEEMVYSGISTNDFLNAVLPEYNTDINDNEKPMKCQQYYREKKNYVDNTGKHWDDRKYYYYENPYVVKEKNALIIDFPCYIQPKINGVRAFIKLVNNKPVIYSKLGLEYNLPHITDWISKRLELFDLWKDKEVILDGELYIYGESLQTIISSVRVNQLNTSRVKFILFDIAVEGLAQNERFFMLYSKECKDILQSEIDAPIELIRTIKIGDDKRVQELTDMYISQGYEGVICRAPTGLYEFGKRPKTIVKLKRTMSDEFTIVAVISQEVDPSLGLFVCQTKEGKIFKTVPKGTKEYQKEVLINASSFIGENLTCTFYEYTPDGLPFHIIDNIVRNYE